jgi:F-type H+-transporting ATPase subunit gamma
MVKADRSAYKIFVVGDKGAVALCRPMADLLAFAITHTATPLNFPTAASIATQVVEHAKECDRTLLMYNEFKNVISSIQKKV